MSARLVDRVLRDIQRGLSPAETRLAHGLTTSQFEELQRCVTHVEKKTAFKIVPRTPDKPRRSARTFRDSAKFEEILDVLGAHAAEDENSKLARSVSLSYMLHANRSKRDEIMWPRREIDRLVLLLAKIGVAAQNIVRLPEDKGVERLELLRTAEPKKSLNHALAWSLVVIYVATSVSDSQ